MCSPQQEWKSHTEAHFRFRLPPDLLDKTSGWQVWMHSFQCGRPLNLERLSSGMNEYSLFHRLRQRLYCVLSRVVWPCTLGQILLQDCHALSKFTPQNSEANEHPKWYLLRSVGLNYLAMKTDGRKGILCGSVPAYTSLHWGVENGVHLVLSCLILFTSKASASHNYSYPPGWSHIPLSLIPILERKREGDSEETQRTSHSVAAGDCLLYQQQPSLLLPLCSWKQHKGNPAQRSGDGLPQSHANKESRGLDLSSNQRGYSSPHRTTMS